MSLRTGLLRFIIAAAWAAVFISSTGVHSAEAAPTRQDDCPESLLDLVWREKPTENFVILYTASHVSLAEQVQQNYIGTLESGLVRYQQAFGSDLALPITIRIYPSRLEYYCLNPQAPVIGPEDLHSHVGDREIVLIADVINRLPSTWETRAVNALRHEIGVLFGEQLSDGDAPPGLLQGLGGYLEDPAETFPERYQAAGQPVRADRGWQRLWEENLSVSDSLAFLQQTSIAAFLIDIYGWEQFIAFLRHIPEVQGYRQAIQDTYGQNLQELYAAWQRYFPIYVESRWQANVVHNYDLSQFEQLLDAGAYADAQSGLQEARPLIDLFGDEAKRQQAQLLLEQAEMGLEAGQLALESRQAILDSDYQIGLDKADQALMLYAELGDTRRVEEVELYREISAEVLELRTELDRLRGGVAALDPIKADRLVAIGRRLAELGDKEGSQEVQTVLSLLGAGQRLLVQWVAVIGLLICVFIIIRRLRGVKRDTSRWGELL